MPGGKEPNIRPNLAGRYTLLRTLAQRTCAAHRGPAMPHATGPGGPNEARTLAEAGAVVDEVAKPQQQEPRPEQPAAAEATAEEAALPCGGGGGGGVLQRTAPSPAAAASSSADAAAGAASVGTGAAAAAAVAEASVSTGPLAPRRRGRTSSTIYEEEAR